MHAKKKRTCPSPLSSFLLVTACVASFFAGRVSSISRASSIFEPPPSRSRPARGLKSASSSVGGDPCDWPPSLRPHYGQEWLDQVVVPYTHPLLPTTGTAISVYATKRPGASYGPHREFWETVADGSWEPTTYRILRTAHTAGSPWATRRRARGGGAAHLDIGGWVGPTTLFAAAVGAKSVIAVEPDPRAFSELHANIRLNPHLAAKIRAVHHCLSPSTGTVTMTGPSPLGSSMSRVVGAARVPETAQEEPNWGQGALVSWEVQCSSPADFADLLRFSPDDFALIKVDIEGAEATLLPPLVEWLGGGGPAGKPPRPALFVELHRLFWTNPTEDAARVAQALSVFPFVYRSDEGTKRHEDRPANLRIFDPVVAVAETGFVCPDEYCMILACDDAWDFISDDAAMAAAWPSTKKTGF